MLLAVAIPIVAAGCGGKSGANIGATRLPKPAYFERADAVCVEAYHRVKAGYQAFVKGKAKPFSSSREIREYADAVLIPAKEQEIRELRALGAPAGDEGKVEAIIDAYQRGVARAREDPRAAVISASGVFVEATELAKGYGFRHCRY